MVFHTALGNSGLANNLWKLSSPFHLGGERTSYSRNEKKRAATIAPKLKKIR